MTNVDELFTPAGFAVALSRGCELSVDVGSTATPGVTVSEDDLSCARCERPIDVPKTKPGLFLAVNKRLNDGLCRRCDPVVGPRTPPDFDP